jgi:hypothetical protein
MTNLLLLLGFFSVVTSTAQPAAPACPDLEGNWTCGLKGGERNERLFVRRQGNSYSFMFAGNESIQVNADREYHDYELGNGTMVQYDAGCEMVQTHTGLRKQLNLGLRFVESNGKFFSSLDSYYTEGGGLVRVRVMQPNSAVKAPPSVMSCSPLIERRRR